MSLNLLLSNNVHIESDLFAVFDDTTYLYFGSAGNTINEGHAHKIRKSDLVETNVLTSPFVAASGLDSTNIYAASKGLGTYAGYGYFIGEAGNLHKIDLTTFTEVAVSAGIVSGSVFSSQIDSTNGILYLSYISNDGAGTYSTRVQKWNIGTLTIIGTTSALQSGGANDVYPDGLAIDLTNGFLYIGNHSGNIFKIRLSDFTLISTIATQAGQAIGSITIDIANQKLYATSANKKIYKVDLSTFGIETTSLDITSVGYLLGSDINLANQVLYAASYSEKKVYKINVSTLAVMDSIDISGSSSFILRTLLIDQNTNLIYVGSDSSGVASSKVFKIEDTGLVPTAPSGLASVCGPNGTTILTWIDNSSDETGFKIERSLDGAAWTQIDTVSAGITEYNDTPPEGNEVLHYYRVRAYNSNGNSDYSNTASVTCRAGISVGATTTARSGSSKSGGAGSGEAIMDLLALSQMEGFL